MYEEKREGVSIKTVILQILIVILFVFLLMWLFPLKLNNNNNSTSVSDTDISFVYEKIFNENVTSMKESAKGYFTTERLPKNTGDIVTITLGEMLQKKIILPFVDKDGKSCDTTGSYVQVKKLDNEYEMKINLKCSTQEDYLIVIMGCYNYCPTGICESQTQQLIKYQYKCPTSGGWSSWSAWQLEAVSATSTKEVKTEVRKEPYTYTEQEDKVVGTTTSQVLDHYDSKQVFDQYKYVFDHYATYSYNPPGLSCTYKTTTTCDDTCVTKKVYTCKIYRKEKVYRTEKVPVYKTVTADKVETVTVTKTGYKDVTYYSYRTYSKGGYYYKWSTSKNDTTLTNKGCSLTGKTETQTVSK
jgi:hypothetical protein